MRNIALALILLCAPVALAQSPGHPLKSQLLDAFDAVKRVPLVDPGMTLADFNTRRLDAEKALDIAKRAVDSDSEKKLYKLLATTLEATVLGKGDFESSFAYGKAANQCRREAFYIFDQDDMTPFDIQQAQKQTCEADFNAATEIQRKEVAEQSRRLGNKP